MSDLEETLAFQLRAAGLTGWEREYKFHPSRRWRFDFAWPELMLAVEVEGGIYSRGRHTRGGGFVNDCEKYAEALLLGWRVLRIPEPWVKSGEGIRIVERAHKELV